MEKNLITPERQHERKASGTESMTKVNQPNETKIPSKIFIDADAFVALARKDDANHKVAVKIQGKIKSNKSQGYTSNFALGEAITIISQKSYVAFASNFAAEVLSGEIDVLEVSMLHIENALKKFSQKRSKNVRFTDMINMVFMDEFKIDTIFSFDKHYPKNGYNLLLT